MSGWSIIFIIILYYLVIKPVLRNLVASLPPNNPNFLRALYSIAGEVASADDEESAHELNMVVNIVRQAFRQPNLSAESIIDNYHRYKNPPLTKEEIDEIAPQLRRVLLEVAIAVAASDHKITDKEIKKIRNIAKRLEIPQSVVDQILNRGTSSRQGTRQDSQGRVVSAVDYALKVMQLDSDATWPEIRKQYKRMAMKLHPDRVSANEKEKATEKFKELGDAYRILKERYG